MFLSPTKNVRTQQLDLTNHFAVNFQTVGPTTEKAYNQSAVMFNSVHNRFIVKYWKILRSRQSNSCLPEICCSRSTLNNCQTGAEDGQYVSFQLFLLLVIAALTSWWPGLVVARWSQSMYVVTLCRARLILGWVTICG